MTRSHVLAGLLLLILTPAAALAAEAQSYPHEIAPGHSHEIESLELQFLAAKNPAQRKHIVADLKALIAAKSRAENDTENSRVDNPVASRIGTPDDSLASIRNGNTRGIPTSFPAGISAEDTIALNSAVTAMLPEADSAEEAEDLMKIASAHPAGPIAGGGSLPKDREFLVNARKAARAARHAEGDVEALADIRIDHLRKDSLGRDGLTLAHLQQVWRINSVQGARSFSPRPVMYASMS